MTQNTFLAELLDASRVAGLQVTPDGSRRIAAVSELDGEGSSYVTRLVELTDAGVLPLTRGGASVGAWALAEDGHVFFTTKRAGDDGKEVDDPSLFVLPPVGEARKLADHLGGFDRVVVKSGVLVAEVGLHSQATDEATHVKLTKERTEAKVSAILHDGFPIRYWNADLGPARPVLAVARIPDSVVTAPATKPSSVDASSTGPEAGAESGDAADPGAASADSELPAQVLHFIYPRMPAGRMLDWQVAPDATFALVTVEFPIPGALEVVEVWRVDLVGDDAPVRLVEASAEFEYEIGEISPDSTRGILVRETSWTPTTNLRADFFVLDTATGSQTPLWSEGDYWYDPVWLDDSTLVATSDDTGRGSVWIGGLEDPEPRRLCGGPGQKYAFSGLAVGGGAVLTTRSAIDVAPHPVAIDPASGTVTELPNPATAVEIRSRLEEVTTVAEDGTEVRAWLVLPEDASEPAPLLVFAHGGPWGSWNSWTFRWNPGPFVEAGYAVLLPDPAISTGYGQSMIDRGQQELGGAPFTDIMALTDAAIARADVDGTRTALAGGSYGGYMANWVAGHTGGRFACIVTHASLWDVRPMGLTSDNASWATGMAEQIAQYSPHLYAEDIEVPMLVIHGDKDYRVPIGQGQQLWFDLLTKARTPLAADGTTQHRFLYFPDEGHWILGRGNVQVWYETVLDFVDHHVRGREPERSARLG